MRNDAKEPANDDASAPAPKRSRRIIASLALLIVALLVVQTWTYRPITTGGAAIPFAADMALVSHAGVGLEAATYSNSREALDAAVARGFTRIEVDFEETRDGRIVAAHDWDQTYLELRPGFPPPPLDRLFHWRAPDHARFMATPMRGGLTPVDAEYLAGWLARHPDVKIVTDIKTDNPRILARLIEAGLPRHQVVPQIYSRAELAVVRRLGFDEVIYTLYRDTGAPILEVIAFAREHGIAVTIHSARVSREMMGAFREAGVPVYVHTINAPEQALRLRDWGAAGVYTDFLAPVVPPARDAD